MRNQKQIIASFAPRRSQDDAFLALFILAFYLLFSNPVLALTVGSVLCGAVAMVLIDIGRAVASVAVMAMGAGILLGKVTWGQAAMMVGGVGLIFGGGSIVTYLTIGNEALIGTGIAAAINTTYAGNAALALSGCGAYGATLSSAANLLSGFFGNFR